MVELPRQRSCIEAYLSYNKLEEYLTDLGESELLEYEVGAQTYLYYGKRKKILGDT